MDKDQLPGLQSMVLLEQGSNQQSTPHKAMKLTIIIHVRMSFSSNCIFILFHLCMFQVYQSVSVASPWCQFH